MKKLPDHAQVQLLVNTVMPWAERELGRNGQFPAAAAWLAFGASEPEFRTISQSEAAPILSIQGQEAMLAAQLTPPWLNGELAAAMLIAPVLYGRNGSGERALAVRLHVEAHGGYCADILMPYRIRTASRWSGSAGNRVHFSHPVAQQSDSRFSGSPAPA